MDDDILLGGDSLYDDEYRRKQQRVRRKSEEAARHAEQEQMQVIRVLIADDQDLVRNGFRLILSSYEHISVVGEARNGKEATELVRQHRPDVVLMDIRMPQRNGIEATSDLTHDPTLSDTHILILTTFDVDEYVYDALAAGASGFMLKDCDPDDLVSAIEVVSKGEALIQPSITKRLIEAFVGARTTKIKRSSASLDSLTDREREIMVQIAYGLTNDEIAERLYISPATVKTHAARVMSKLEVHDRAQLVVLAYENGLVVPGT